MIQKHTSADPLEKRVVCGLKKRNVLQINELQIRYPQAPVRSTNNTALALHIL